MNESTLSTAGDWAREVVPTEPASTPTQDGTSAGSAHDRRIATVLATAMVVGPLAMTAWFLVEPSVLPREDPQLFLASVATSPFRYLVGTGLVVLSGLAGLVGAVGLARVLGRRLPRLGLVVGVLAFLSGAGLLVQAGFRAFVWSLVEQDVVPASSVTSYDRFQTGGLFDVLVAPGLVFGGVATLITVGALFRTRLVPLWVPAVMVGALVLSSGEFADPVTIAGAALGATANLVLARQLFRRG